MSSICYWSPVIKKLILLFGVCILPGTVLNFIDWLIDFEPHGQWSKHQLQGNQWILSRQLHSRHQPAHSQPECLSTQKTDRPSQHHTPRPDMQFISWKTCRRAKGGRALYLVSLHQPLFRMLYLDSFHPPADRRVYMGPSVKDLRLFHRESFHLCSLPGGDQNDSANRTRSYDALNLCA